MHKYPLLTFSTVGNGYGFKHLVHRFKLWPGIKCNFSQKLEGSKNIIERIGNNAITSHTSHMDGSYSKGEEN